MEAILRVEQLNKKYDTEHALKDVSFTVSRGEVVVIIGPSGCGKSTLLRCINGLEKLQSGKITLNGQALTEGKPDWSAVRQRVGMV